MPTYDTHASDDGATMAAVSVGITVANQPNRILVAVGTTFSTGNLTGVTNGTRFKFVQDSRVGNGSGDFTSAWYLINPPVGANTVTVLGADGGCSLTVYSLYDVSPHIPVGPVVSATGNSTAPSVTLPSSAMQLVIDALTWSSGSQAMNAHTNRTERNNVATFSNLATSTTIPGISSTPNDWTGDTSTPWAMIAFGVNGFESAVRMMKPNALRPNIFAPGNAR